jgi:hypothetical protein
MNYFKKNKLISFILIAMILGLVVGFGINKYITNNKYVYNKSKLESISNPIIKKPRNLLKYMKTNYLKLKKKRSLHTFLY